jgi:sigma-B regulation protein RsbU (phosphoserine phosphatase)
LNQPSADRLALLYRTSQTFNSSLDLDQVLNSVIDEVIAATRAERGFLMLRNAEGQLVFRAARGMDQQAIDEPRFQISRGVVERVAAAGQPQLTSDAQSDAWLSKRESVVVMGLRSIGVIYVDNRLQAGLFTPDDLELLTAIAASAAVAIDNARLYQVAVEKGRLERELQVAREVQASLLPRATPRIEGWEFAARWQPARQVAGDFYDFVVVDDGSLGLVIADVTDKGMPAALFMALSRSILRASVTHARSPADGIAHANRLICADAANGMFVTLFYAQLFPATGELVYVNAGHNPPLLYDADRDQLSKLTRTGMVLGIDESARLDQRTVRLDSGDFILLYTDGVIDALNAQEQEFGEERLRQVVLENRGASAADMVDGLTRSISSFTGSTAPFDDITLMVARRP